MRTLAAFALFTALVSSAEAQNFMGGGAPPTMSGWGRAAGFARPIGHGFQSYGGVFVGNPWLADYSSVPAPSAVPVVILQQPAATPQPPETPKSAEPLLIELQGDHYVRMQGSEASSRNLGLALDYSEAAGSPNIPPKSNSHAAAASSKTGASQTQQQAIVLVYRDGHKEDVARYSIAGPILYVQNEFWTAGSWTRRVPLSTLDLPATINANRASGAKFELPSGPNVVVASF